MSKKGDQYYTGKIAVTDEAVNYNFRRTLDWFDLDNPGLRQELYRVNQELVDVGRTDGFYSSLGISLNKYGSLTERQVAALKRSLTQYHDRNEQIVARRQPRVQTAPIPTGRVTITGGVVSTKWVENDYGGSLKMLVESDQGWRVFGTVPSRLADAGYNNPDGSLVGLKIAFTALVTPKEADCGFFSRPTGGAVLKDEPAPQPEALEPAPPVTLPTGGWASHKKVYFAPIAKDLCPQDIWLKHNVPLVKESPARQKPTSLADMVKAAGYTSL
jgi:hypothetical protein